MRALAITLMCVVAAGWFFAAAQPQISGWGATRADRQATWAGDGLVPDPSLQRRTMLGIKARAENAPRPLLDELEPVAWLLAASVVVVGVVSAMFARVWWRPLSVAGAAAAVLPALMFWQPPILLGFALDLVLVIALLRCRRQRIPVASYA